MIYKSGYKGPGILFGGAFAIMVFAVLCLALFTAFTLMNARAELDLSKKYAGFAQAYYSADSLAASFLCDLAVSKDLSGARLAAKSAGAHIERDGEFSFYTSFMANVNITSGLYIEAKAYASEKSEGVIVTVIEKKLIYCGIWPEDTKNLLPVAAYRFAEE